MAGKRSWFVVRREILAAASGMVAKGQALTELLFVPEPFHVDQVAQLRQRQVEALAPLAASSAARMMLLGEVKGIEDARFGTCLVVKHLPELRFMMHEDLHRRLVARFGAQLHLWGQLDGSHLMILATVSRSAQGVLVIEAACLLNLNEHWLPFETLFEWQMLDALHRAPRRFTKGLRYNLASSRPLASAILQDRGEVPTALFVVPQGQEAAYDGLVDEVESHGHIQTWRWNVGHEAMPALP